MKEEVMVAVEMIVMMLLYEESSTKRVSFYSPRLIDFEWKDEDILSKVMANIRHSHKYLKVVELFGFTGFRSQVEFILYLVGTAILLEKLIIHVRIPWHYWEYDILMFGDQNSITAKKSSLCPAIKNSNTL
ncbi:hypothetical protein FEM48_Zijuj09G0083000 [Ziziphus jujuba var. spinosa]|uniref:Uncharacterized protein n=1 Tax=Ziziphus jujuba var. spinosa TaxID=714518 RepID=A0A978URV9_ZIZJJ|nr:hypothetical protein FEM48_Zijuj09G0083000 [Ziziphus jujuba var. spinosa]